MQNLPKYLSAEEVREKLKFQTKFKVLGEEFEVVEYILWWQARANGHYAKYALLDKNGDKTSRLFISDGVIGLAKLIHHDFQEPLPDSLEFEGKTYKKATTGEFCVAREVEGEDIVKVGDIEFWWDFVDSKDKTEGLSLGRNWESWKREDLRYKLIDPEDITFI